MKKLLIPIVAAVTLLLASCGAKAMEPYKDAPTSSDRNSGEATVIEMPDGFSNLATKCDNGNRIYVAYKGDLNRAAIAVVGKDKTCPQPSGS